MKTERTYEVIRKPHISEKATICTELNNQYVFQVARDAEKSEIREAVEELFKVKVSSVRTLNVKGKTKRNRYGIARRPGWKKAYVGLAEGHSIDYTTVDAN